jgi:hypothetical protein
VSIRHHSKEIGALRQSAILTITPTNGDGNGNGKPPKGSKESVPADHKPSIMEKKSM